MQCNVGTTEKIIRIILGLVFIWVGLTYSPWWYIIATILLLTAAIGWCPLYKVVGINTCKQKEEQKTEAPVEETTIEPEEMQVEEPTQTENTENTNNNEQKM